MNPVLVVRSEIVCLVILLFILLYSRFYDMGKDHGNFLRICIFAIGHVAFDLITVLTVNNVGAVPPVLNRICHIIFYLFALLFSYEFFCYTVALCYPKKPHVRLRLFGALPLIVYVLIVPFLPMVYLTGNGTNYSFGPAAIVGYGVGIVLFLSSIVVVLRNIKKLENHVRGALLPMLCAAIICEIIQILVPELLFTGGAITLITVGFFYSLENPVAVLRKKVLTDALTGVESRHSYEADIAQMDRRFAAGEQYSLAFFDINDLKAVNDNRGHLEGDDYIGCIAQILTKSLTHAQKLYRMGGDEFLAVFHNQDDAVIAQELALVHSECEQKSLHSEYPISVAVGSASSSPEYSSLRDVLRMADFRMYANKAKRRQQKSFLLFNADELNISGLTDRIFDAFADADTNRFLYVANLSTNVTRWSLSAAEYLGLSGVFLYDCKSVLLERIHPDDRKLFQESLQSVTARKLASYHSEFRIRSAGGDYVSCVCSGALLLGKNGDPDLLAGAVSITEAADCIDKLTGLRNGRELTYDLNRLIREHTPAAVLKLSITNLSRINMLYGFLSGNEVLKQFSEIIRRAVGESGCVFCAEATRFVVTLPNASRAQTTALYQAIRRAAEQQIHLDTIAPPMDLAAGAYLLPSDCPSAAAFVQSNLTFAHDQSRFHRRGQLVYYDEYAGADLDSAHQARLMCIHQDAIGSRCGFFLAYQPIVSAQSGQIVGAEALLRWRAPDFGVVPPSSFIPWLEADPCFVALGRWILLRALTEAEDLRSVLPDFVLNVNVTMQQLEHEDFGVMVLELLEQTGFPARQLCLELTERCREMNVEQLSERVSFFRSRGIRMALDDLGTGFSSFGLLLSLHVDEIKLDQAFVREIQTKRANQILTKLLIDASNQLGYTTCLEGVEDEALCRYLSTYGATYYQGYYCHRPMPAKELAPLILQWNK